LITSAAFIIISIMKGPVTVSSSYLHTGASNA